MKENGGKSNIKNDLSNGGNFDPSLLYELDEYGTTLYQVLKKTSPLDDVTLEGQQKVIKIIAENISSSFGPHNLQDDMDPKFTIMLKSIDVVFGLRDVFQKMGIQTLGDLVKYQDIEEFTTDYQKKIGVRPYERANGSQLSKRTEKNLTGFMKENKLSFGMSTKLSDKISADQEKMKKLLGLSFDLSNLEHKKAMKEFGIDNTSGIFTKLFDHGINNFQELVNTYTSVDDIVIDGLGKRGKTLLSQDMKNNNLSFGMDISSYI